MWKTWHGNVFRVVWICLGIVASSLSIQASDLFFEADTIDYHWEKQQVEASGNIQAFYKDYRFSSDHLTLDINEGNLSFPQTLSVEKDNVAATANQFAYNYKQYDGKAKAIHVRVGDRLIHGHDVSMNPLFVEIKRASITTCSNEHPHLELVSDTILVYPQFGYVVVWNSLLNINGFPVLPIPTYIFGARQYSVFGDASPFPEIGTSVLEGLYARQNFGYILNENISGVIVLGTSEKLGGLVGFDQNFRINASNALYTNVSLVKELGIVGGITYMLDLAEAKNNDDDSDFLSESIEQFSQSVQLPLSRVSLMYQYKKQENEYWVDKKPLINLEINDFEINDYGIHVSSQANFGLVAEEDKFKRYLEAWRSNIDFSFERFLFKKGMVNVSTKGKFFGYWYDTGDTWQRIFADFYFDWRSGNTGARFTFSKLLFDTGDSLFSYNEIGAQQYDELGFLMFRDIFGHEVGFEFYYVLSPEALASNDWQDRLRTLDVYTKLQFHCWKLVLRANTIRETAFNVGVEIF